jgi:hypothetical protein
MLQLEGDRWMLTLGGILGDHPPTDPDGLLGFARSLRFPDIYETILTPRRWTTRSPSASGSASGTATSGWTAPPEPFPAQACSGPGYRHSQ